MLAIDTVHGLHLTKVLDGALSHVPSSRAFEPKYQLAHRHR